MTQPRNVWTLGKFGIYFRRKDGLECAVDEQSDFDNARASAIIYRDQLALKYGEDEHDVYIQAWVGRKEG